MPGAAGVECAPMMRLLCAAACLLIALNASLPAQSRRGADARNMELVGHNDLNGGGDGGEGLALHMWPDGRRILYLAHEAPDRCLSIVDVTRPEAPALLNQLRSPAPGITRCNSLGLSGNVLAVANQAAKAGGAPAGMWVLDVSSPARVIAAKSLDDLKLSFSTHRGFRTEQHARRSDLGDGRPSRSKASAGSRTLVAARHAERRRVPPWMPAAASLAVRQRLSSASDRDLAGACRSCVRRLHRRRGDDLRHRRARAGCVRKRAFVHASTAWPRAVPSTVSGVDPHVSTDVQETAGVGVRRRHGGQLQGRTEAGLVARHPRGNQSGDRFTGGLYILRYTGKVPLD